MSPIRSLPFAVALVVAVSSTPPVAAVTIEGSMLSIAASSSGPTLTLKAKDNVDSGNFGSDGDPRCAATGGGGGALRVNGGPGNDFTIALPCEGWSASKGSASNAYNTDYIYRDNSGATCSRVSIKHGDVLSARCRGPHVAYSLGAPQGNIDVTLRVGSLPIRNCMTFGPPPTTVVRDGSDGKKYLAKHAPAPADCTSP